MPSGRMEIVEAGAGTQFSSERQPDKYRQPDTITGFLKQELASDGYAVFEDAEVFDPITKKPTGEKVTVRIKLVTSHAVARKLLSNANKGRERSIEMVLERTEGKVPQRNEHSTPPGETLKFENVSTANLEAALKLLEPDADGS